MGLVKPILLSTCVFLFAPVVVLGQVTLYTYDFENPEWVHDWHDPTGWHMGPHASFSAHDGSLFCNLTEVIRAGSSWGGGGKQWSIHEYLFAGLEMRVKLSSDNKLESDFGGGIRRWGFRSKDVSYRLMFRSMEEGILSAFNSEMLGFMACAQLDGDFVFLKQIEGIDLTEWHTYKILWEPENATFLIDGVVVAETDKVPQVGMSIHLNWWAGTNLTLHCHTSGQEEVCVDEYLQVDYIRVFLKEGRLQEMDSEISGLLSSALQLIENHEQQGKNSSQFRKWYAEAQDDWQKDHIYVSSKKLLQKIVAILGQWDEVVDMFSQANATIEDAEQTGATDRDINTMKGYYNQAENSWEAYNIQTTKYYLQKILDVPEPALLPILGPVLLPALLRRRR
jgi:hypothetical protein